MNDIPPAGIIRLQRRKETGNRLVEERTQAWRWPSRDDDEKGTRLFSPEIRLARRTTQRLRNGPSRPRDGGHGDPNTC